jgi:hypothetical protein
MRVFLTVLLVSAMASAQAAKPTDAPTQARNDASGNSHSSQNPGAPARSEASAQSNPKPTAIPAGARIPLLLKQAISTKNAREGDAVYAETAFPFVLNDRVLVPAGTYVQGKIEHVQRAGRVKGRAEILMHFTSLIYPSGYTVLLPGSVQNTPGADDKGIKDKEGTIQQDKTTRQRVEDAGKGAAVGTLAGATVGGLASGSSGGALAGAGAGAAAGVAWALLKRGPDVKLEVGSSIEMEIQREIPLDPSRIFVAKVAE